MKELFSQLLLAVITVSVPIITTFICNGINKWIKALKKEENVANSEAEKNKIEFTNKYLSYLESLVVSSVKMVSQTYVDSLKDKNNFTKEKQLEAFQKAYDNVMAMLSEDSKNILNDLFDDLEAVIRTLIERSVSENKIIDSEPSVLEDMKRHPLSPNNGVDDVAYLNQKKNDGLSFEETVLALSKHIKENGETPVTLKVKGANVEVIPIEFVPESCAEVGKGIVYKRLISEEVENYIFTNIPTIIDYCQTDRGKHDFLNGNIIMFDIVARFPDGRDERLIFEDFLEFDDVFILICKLGDDGFGYIIDRHHFDDITKLDVIESGELIEYYTNHASEIKNCEINYVYIHYLTKDGQLFKFEKVIDKDHKVILQIRDMKSHNGEIEEVEISNK